MAAAGQWQQQQQPCVESGSVVVTEVEFTNISPRGFWRNYISKRQAVVIRGIDSCWADFTDDLLVSKAGGALVMVEQRASTKESYGQGKKTAMQFGQFIQAMQQGNSGLYMSTQEVGVGHDGHPLLLGPPLIELTQHFPQQHALMGHLVPQSINMWMGCAPEGSSSGLHHDFHDNLYVLLRGCKRFRLFPPSCAPGMYVHGKVKKIYPNGRIVYEGQGNIQPDGSDVKDVRLWQARQRMDQAAAAIAVGNLGQQQGCDTADMLLEQQLEHMLYEGASTGFHADDFADDYIDSDAAADSSSDEEGLEGRKSHNKRRLNAQQPPHQKQHKTARRQVPAKPLPAAEAVAEASEASPVNFSQIDLSLPEQQLRRRFPHFPGLSAACEVVLQAGQMLYLPCGWFHEVTSYGGAGLDGGHLAINYWYHPPDNLDSSKVGYKQPYTSSYHSTIWQQRQCWLDQNTRQWYERTQRAEQQPHLHQQQQQRYQQPQQKRKQLQQQRRQVQPTASHTAVVSSTSNMQTGGAASGAKHIVWGSSVHEPSNRYRTSLTRENTATGGVGKLPTGDEPHHRNTAHPTLKSNPAGIHPINKAGDDGPSSKSAADGVHAEQPKQKKQQGLAVSLTPSMGIHNATVQHHMNGNAGKNVLGSSSSSGSSEPDAAVITRSIRQSAVDQHNQDSDEDDQLSKEVADGIAAVENYFSGNTDSANALLAEFLAQRRQRLAGYSRGDKQEMMIPRLFGRRHHYTVAVKLVPRKPAHR